MVNGLGVLLVRPVPGAFGALLGRCISAKYNARNVSSSFEAQVSSIRSRWETAASREAACLAGAFTSGTSSRAHRSQQARSLADSSPKARRQREYPGRLAFELIAPKPPYAPPHWSHCNRLEVFCYRILLLVSFVYPKKANREALPAMRSCESRFRSPGSAPATPPRGSPRRPDDNDKPTRDLAGSRAGFPRASPQAPPLPHAQPSRRAVRRTLCRAFEGRVCQPCASTTRA